jgi:hypothetical protein
MIKLCGIPLKGGMIAVQYLGVWNVVVSFLNKGRIGK